MNRGFGREIPGSHGPAPHRRPARYLIVIDSGGTTVVRLFTEALEGAGEFDAGTEEVATMTRGLSAVRGAAGPEWDRALEGHSAAEREAAEVYTLDV